MDIQTVVNTYFILLLVGAVICFFIGFGLKKKFNSHKIGFYTTFILSLIILVFLIQWFKTASAELFIGTLPWLFNQAIAIILYPIYLAFTWFVLKRTNIKKF
ncbi:hypothetical protein AS034_12755 [[Bacillus] enclensis]|uniref:Uncharacterized protein n=1 Tax=[Bacillus] enclensis TaxID=1402860 RepID=A0A0V8HGR1_9BACI|nr:hypothetical protein [[Bacillus] enclensis]KSU61706.1 hypothetical protein AS034_12755 [[Bacillus] enclensis]SCC14057.1 hypothetical protein GA0061094_2641 [[Bacillus] enclensis]